MGIEIQSSGFRKRIQAMQARAPTEATAFVNEVSKMGQTLAQNFAAVDSGELRESILLDPVRIEDGEIVGGYGTNNDHAVYVEYGTGQRGLSGEVANGMAKDPEPVNYREDWAGMPAQPFMYPAIKEVEKELPAMLEKLGKNIVGGENHA
jgi:hypothetical protein